MSPKTQFAISFLQANLHRPLTIVNVTDSIGLSRSRLSHLFKTEVGVSLSQYLKRARLETAQKLLETSPKSVKQIACEVGYNYASHFMRDFKKAHGCTPSQYRTDYLRFNLMENGRATDGQDDLLPNRTSR